VTAAAKVKLVCEILTAYLRVRRRVRGGDFRTVVRDIRADPQAPKADGVEAARLGRAVFRTLRLLPTDSRCLMQSLVLTALLARRGIPSALVIGVAPGGTFTAHAWVEAGGQALLPPREHLYERLVEL
jgi:hypothetical protein